MKNHLLSRLGRIVGAMVVTFAFVAFPLSGGAAAGAVVDVKPVYEVPATKLCCGFP
ncbi:MULTISPECIES: hypothetical protein [Microbispora]|uniref:hypothetical protein n=1 Tax=Microbispora TaxID=2005 RepID=UPI0014043910|nr:MULTISPECIES: hypothetical protein [Microbispora]GLW22719.1 hypothetical protein Mame01_27620 [Microbispora amethystogenes]